MILMLSPNQKPAIFIYVLGQVDEDALSQLGFGMEEEGIPFERTSKELAEFSLLEMAHQASQASPLSVGLAIDRGTIYLHYRNLRQADFLYCLNTYRNKSKGILRILGTNAARLVKGSPLIKHEALETSFGTEIVY